MISTYPVEMIKRLEEERDKFKEWFEMKSKSNARLLVELSRANLRIEQLEYEKALDKR